MPSEHPLLTAPPPATGTATGLSPPTGIALGEWYHANGRHDLPWRATRDRWAVLVSEVMLQQTQVARVLGCYEAFLDRFPDPGACAEAGPGAVIEQWGRLGYPRRARRLWESAVEIASRGWPADLTTLPGIGRYTARAVTAQADDHDVPAVEVNIRRVAERVAGRRLPDPAAEMASVEIGAPLVGRKRLLALMDLGALVCRSSTSECSVCPLHEVCATRGVLATETRPSRQARYEGSMRQRRGRVLAALRAHGDIARDEIDDEALTSLVADGLAVIDHQGRVRLP